MSNAPTPAPTPVPTNAPRESEQAQCAHLRISYRTEEVRYDGPDVPSPAGSPHVGLRAGAMLTRGWWECDFNCGAKFLPAAAPLPTAPEPMRFTCEHASYSIAPCRKGCNDAALTEDECTHYGRPYVPKPAPTAPEVGTPGLTALLEAHRWAVTAWDTLRSGEDPVEVRGKMDAARTAIEAHVLGLESRISGLQAIVRHYGKLTEANEASEAELAAKLAQATEAADLQGIDAARQGARVAELEGALTKIEDGLSNTIFVPADSEAAAHLHGAIEDARTALRAALGSHTGEARQ